MARRPATTSATFGIAVLIIGALLSTAPASAETATSASGSAFGLQLGGPVPVGARPSVESSVPPGTDDHQTDELLEVPADPVATSFTALVEADSSIEGSLETRLGAVMEGQAGGLPQTWNGRGFAITEDLEAINDSLTADVIESESTAACENGKTIFGSATRVVNLSLAGREIPVLNPDPNTELIDQAGVRIVFWETNWDPDSKTTSDGALTVFTNALHVTAPAGIDLVVSHSEATANCAGAPVAPAGSVEPPPEVGAGNEEAPAPEPVELQPQFTG